MKVDIHANELPSMGDDAREEFRTETGKFAKEVLREAQRLESSTRSTGNAEITTSHVSDAWLLMRRGYRPQRKSKLRVVGIVAIYLLAIVAGIAGNNLKEQWGQILLAACILFAIAVTVSLEWPQ
ncbi:MAG: hypothetical protein Q7T55_06455 [Solirubrobacteraceae bacterium]|nr:hypothetical protein [Solirubrobacteraceae bacterium]